MCVDVADAASHQFVPFDEVEHLIVRCHRQLRQSLEQMDHAHARFQVAAGTFPDYERVGRSLARLLDPDDQRIASAKVIYPNRRVQQNHFPLASLRRHTGGLSAASVPPKRANLLALSR